MEGATLISRLQFGSKKQRSDRGAGVCPPASGLFQRIPALLDELKEYANDYFSAQKDLTRAKAKQFASKAILGSLALVAVLAVVAVSVLLVLTGIALGLGELFGDRPWLGFLVTGLLLLGIIGLAGWFGLQRWQKSSRESTIRRYEQRHELQRQRFHRSVDQPGPGVHKESAAPRYPAAQREPIR